MAGPLDTSSSFWHAKAAIARTFANRKPPADLGTRDSLCPVARGLYLSSCHLEAQKELLKCKNITHILQVGKELSPTHPAAFTYKHVPVYDLEEEDLVKYFPECFHFIDVGRETGAVLVHCAAGISRSASVVIGYLMATGGLSLEDARAAVKAERPAINPNQGFLLQLQLFQEAGCSAEGWQRWDLERFLRVRSAAYSRSGAPAALAAAAAAENSVNLMRGACELAPPVLSREDSISPHGSPTHSPVRGEGSQDPTPSGGTAPGGEPPGLLTASTSVDRIGGSCGGQWGVAGKSHGLKAAGATGGSASGGGTAAQARGGAGGRAAAGAGYRLPALPAVGASAASGGLAAAAVAASVAAASAVQAYGASQSQPPSLGPSRSLQRQRSAGDAVVGAAVALAPTRPAAQSLSTIGAATSSTATRDYTGGFIDNDSGRTFATGVGLGPAWLGDSMGFRSAISSGFRRLGLGAVPARARTASGVADPCALSMWAAVQSQEQARASAPALASLPAWAQPETRPSDVASGAGRELGTEVTAPAKTTLQAAVGPAPRPGPSQSSSDCSRGVGSSPSGASRASNEGPGGARAHSFDDSTAVTAIVPDPRAEWLLAPGAQQPFQQRALQPPFDAGAPPVLSPIPSDGGASDDGCRRDADDDGAEDGAGGGGDVSACFFGSARQLRLREDEPSLAGPAPRRGGSSRHGFLRRSLSDRLQGMLASAFPALAATMGTDSAAEGGGETAGATWVSRPPVRSDGVVAFQKGGLEGLQMGSSGGRGDSAATGQSQPHGFEATATPGPGPAPRAVVAAAAQATSPRLSTDSGVSSSVLAPVWPDGSGSGGSSSSSSTAISRTSTAEGPYSGGGSGAAAAAAAPVEERSDATSGGVGATGDAGRGAASCAAATAARRYGSFAPGGHDGGGGGGGATPTSAALPSPTSPDDGPGPWALGHRHRRALVPVLTPAGLERTPSKAPLAPLPTPASAFAAPTTPDAGDCSGGATAFLAPESAGSWLPLPMAWPQACSPLDGDDGGSATARSAALSHLVAAQALSHGAAAAAVTAAVRSDPEIAAFRTPRIGSAAASPRGAHPGPSPIDSSRQGPHHGHADAGVAAALFPGGRAAAATAAGSGGIGGAKAASRLATATFAHAAGAASCGDGLTAGGGRCECSGSSISSGGGADDGGGDGAVAVSSFDEGVSVTDGEPPQNLQRYSAPSTVSSGWLSPAEGMAAAAALPPADSVASPPTAAPARGLRLSIRSLHGPSQGGAAATAAAAGADAGRADGGAVTPIHKRVLRSLTSFLSRSPESPTGAAAAASRAAGGTATPRGYCGDGAAGARGGEAGAGSSRCGAVHAGASAFDGAALRQHLLTGGRSSEGVVNLPPVSDNEAAGASSEGPRRLLTTSCGDTQSVVRVDALLPPAASSLPGRVNLASDVEGVPAAAAAPPPLAPWSGLTLGAQVDGGDGSDSADGSSSPSASGVGRVLFRSRSSSPSCALASAGGGACASWPSDGDAAEPACALGRQPCPEPEGLAAWGARAGMALGCASAGATASAATGQDAWGGAMASLEEEEEEEAIGIDMLPNAPLHWGTGGAEAAEPAAAAAWAAWGPDALAAGASVTVAATARAAAAATVAAVAEPHRCGSRHSSWDGRGHGDEEVEAVSATRPAGMVATTGTGSAAAAAASYLAGLASMASAVLLPAPSDAVQLDGTPTEHTVGTAAPPAATATTTAPAMTAAATAAAWWQAPAATAATGGGGGMQRAASVGAQGLSPLTSPSGAAAQNRRSDGLALLGLVGLGAEAVTHGSAVPPDHEPTGLSRIKTGAGVGASAHAKRPRTSYSGALSMLAPAGRHGPEASAGAGASAHAAVAAASAPGASPQWPLCHDLQQPGQPAAPPTAFQHTSAPAPTSSPSQQTHAFASPADFRQHDGAAGRTPYGGSATAAGVGVSLPAWGGSRSSACLVTVPSDPEPPEPGTTGRSQQMKTVSKHETAGLERRHPPLACQEGPHQPPPPALRQRLNELGPAQGSAPSGRATVRSSSMGSAAAVRAVAAATGSLAADTAWEHMRAAPKQQQQQLPLQQHQFQEHRPLNGGTAASAAGPSTVSLPCTAAAADPRAVAQAWSSTTATLPMLELSLNAPAPAPSAAGPGAASTAAAPSTAPAAAGSPSISPSSAAAIVMAVRMSLSPTASSGGGSTGTQSPRAPPAVSDTPDFDPLELDAGPSSFDAAAAAAVSRPAVPWRAFDTTAAAALAAAPAGAGCGRHDTSLLKPVLGRRLLPMPSPSRIILGSPAGTPRGSTGGAGAPPPTSATHTVHLPQRPLPVSAPVAAAPAAAGAPGPQSPAPRPAAHVADLRVLLPDELRAAERLSGSGAGGGGAAGLGGSSGSPTSASVPAGLEAAGERASSGGGAASLPRPLGGADACVDAGGARERDRDRPAGSPGAWSGLDVRSPSAVCGSQVNSDDGGPGGAAA